MHLKQERKDFKQTMKRLKNLSIQKKNYQYIVNK